MITSYFMRKGGKKGKVRSRKRKKLSHSSVVEHMPRMQGILGSNPGGIWQFSASFHLTSLTSKKCLADSWQRIDKN